MRKRLERLVSRTLCFFVVGMFVTLTAGFQSVAVADPVPTPDPGITDKTIVVIPNHAKYKVVGVPGTHKAPFGSGDGCPLQSTVKSFWPVSTVITLKKGFTLPPGAHNLRVQLSIDNDAEIFINGTSIGVVTHGFCPLVDEFLIISPDPLLLVGPNVLKVVATDLGGESFIDLRVLVDLP
ncbi:MAG: hypothetical protein A3G93_13105 [Nitrospinae bacterium RIFCSPLOWO2_12_FULL_45_22]|nr:MAG: hypothetical protein A3G93_13105 [Nitrospinae bacterium RIFCSPLOWO2_12_FULL_45_22]